MTLTAAGGEQLQQRQKLPPNSVNVTEIIIGFDSRKLQNTIKPGR